MLYVDSALWFLALDNALVNGDGYWIRASDYSLFEDEKGVFHLIPQDMNETFTPASGPGFGGGPGGRGPGGRGGRGPGGGPFGGPFGGPGGPNGGPSGPGGSEGGPGPGFNPNSGPPSNSGDVRAAAALEGPGPGAEPGPGGRRPGTGGPGFGGPGGRGGGIEIDPLVGKDDLRKPLRSRLLAVPRLKAIYLDHVRTLAEQTLDWNKLKPVVAQYRALIEKEIEADTRKLNSLADFQAALAETVPTQENPTGRPSSVSLRAFAEKRRNYLLHYPDIAKLASPAPQTEAVLPSSVAPDR
jgi:hypothetical protein